jgi:TPR repeat protein
VLSAALAWWQGSLDCLQSEGELTVASQQQNEANWERSTLAAWLEAEQFVPIHVGGTTRVGYYAASGTGHWTAAARYYGGSRGVVQAALQPVADRLTALGVAYEWRTGDREYPYLDVQVANLAKLLQPTEPVA